MASKKKKSFDVNKGPSLEKRLHVLLDLVSEGETDEFKSERCRIQIDRRTCFLTRATIDSMRLEAEEHGHRG
jgi:hypothetical protein